MLEAVTLPRICVLTGICSVPGATSGHVGCHGVLPAVHGGGLYSSCHDDRDGRTWGLLGGMSEVIHHVDAGEAGI